MRCVIGSDDEEYFRRTAEATVAMIDGTVGISSDDVVVEIGAGVGRVGQLVAPRCSLWIGTEVSPNMILHLEERLRSHRNFQAVLTSGYDLSPIKSESATMVYCTLVFMHLDEWERFARDRASGAIGPRGRSVPAKKRRTVRSRTVGRDQEWVRGVILWACTWKVHGR